VPDVGHSWTMSAGHFNNAEIEATTQDEMLKRGTAP
jgi:hypothetical protein